jgi:hypothetical protein
MIVADFCAYVFKRFLMGDRRYERFFDPFRSQIVTFDDAWLARQRGKVMREMRRSGGQLA